MRQKCHRLLSRKPLTNVAVNRTLEEYITWYNGTNSEEHVGEEEPKEAAGSGYIFPQDEGGEHVQVNHRGKDECGGEKKGIRHMLRG